MVSLQDESKRKMADGEIFNTITNGKNTMMAYGPNIPVADRWAIIAYLRALQRSQNATIADVPEEHRAELDKPAETKPRNLRSLPYRNGRHFLQHSIPRLYSARSQARTKTPEPVNREMEHSHPLGRPRPASS